MARRKRNDSGEQFSGFLGFYLPPTLLTELKAAAANERTSTSDLARQILSKGLGNPATAIVVRPDAQTEAKIRSVIKATTALNAVGNLMNQIARHVNSVQELGPYAADLREAIGQCERVAGALLDSTVALIPA